MLKNIMPKDCGRVIARVILLQTNLLLAMIVEHFYEFREDVAIARC